MSREASTSRRLWRYEIDEVWGNVSPGNDGIEVGGHIVDTWKSNRTWTVMNFETGETWGWHAKAHPEEGQIVDGRWEALVK